MLFPLAPFHWLDTNVFIQAANQAYSFKSVPSFWRWLEKASRDGLIRSPISVYNEIKDGTDQLARWVRVVKKSSGMFVNPDSEVQKCYKQIVLFVYQRYSSPEAAGFMRGADPWVIAHAMDNRGTVVTHEVLVPPESQKVKIPNVCAQFDVDCIRAWDAFPKLGMEL